MAFPVLIWRDNALYPNTPQLQNLAENGRAGVGLAENAGATGQVLAEHTARAGAVRDTVYVLGSVRRESRPWGPGMINPNNTCRRSSSFPMRPAASTDPPLWKGLAFTSRTVVPEKLSPETSCVADSRNWSCY